MKLHYKCACFGVVQIIHLNSNALSTLTYKIYYLIFFLFIMCYVVKFCVIDKIVNKHKRVAVICSLFFFSFFFFPFFLYTYIYIYIYIYISIYAYEQSFKFINLSHVGNCILACQCLRNTDILSVLHKELKKWWLYLIYFQI